MRIEQYQHLREKELEAAVFEAREEVQQGKYYSDSIEQHIARVTDE